MAATKRQMNVTSCIFTPTGGSATTYTGVTGVNIDTGGSLAVFSGDGDRFPTTVVNDFNDATVSIQCADMAAAYANPNGTRGTLVYVSKDAKLATGGNITVTVATAIIENITFNTAHRQYGQFSVNFKTESADGSTNPISFTAA